MSDASKSLLRIRDFQNRNRVGTSPNQKLKDTGTRLLGEAYPSIVGIRSQIDGIETPNFWQQDPATRYVQETDANGKAVLGDLPIGSWGVFVGSDRFKLVLERERIAFTQKSA